MNRVTKKLMQSWSNLGPRYLPFADAASDDLPLSRLLRLSLFQASAGMALVLLVGTLNRVMIVELHVPASIVSVMISLPIIFAPFRALIGFRSDNHKSALGWRRVPYIWMGTLVQFGGLSIMPFALLVLSGGGQSHQAPVWIGWAASGLAFLLVGAGIHILGSLCSRLAHHGNTHGICRVRIQTACSICHVATASKHELALQRRYSGHLHLRQLCHIPARRCDVAVTTTVEQQCQLVPNDARRVLGLAPCHSDGSVGRRCAYTVDVRGVYIYRLGNKTVRCVRVCRIREPKLELIVSSWLQN